MTSPRRPRADAARNRERLLEAAKAVFGAGGPDASLEAVARAAGLGIGTLYRHFPNREALYAAVYRHEVEQLAQLVERLKGDMDPVAALRRWLAAMVGFVATKKGMAAALAVAMQGTSDLALTARERLTGALRELVERAVAAGAIRADVDAGDLLSAVVAFCLLQDRPGWQATALRFIDVFLDGLRRSEAGSIPSPR